MRTQSTPPRYNRAPAKTAGDKVTGGAVNADGVLLFEATAVGGATMLSQIIKLVEDAQAVKAPIQRLVDHVSAVFVPVVLLISVATLVGWGMLTGDWQALYDEVRAFREACGEAHLKTILGVGELATLTNVARASLVAMMAGSDFIKTSTGKETSNATLPVGLVMTRMIREFGSRYGHEIGFKPAGGIRSAKQALEWLVLMKEELGDRWLRPHLFRFGASGLLTDVERQLEHFVTGRYAASHRQPMV